MAVKQFFYQGKERFKPCQYTKEHRESIQFSFSTTIIGNFEVFFRGSEEIETNRRKMLLCPAFFVSWIDYPYVFTALNTGMRKEEILSLEWDRHVDLRHSFILLDQTKNGARR